MYVCVYIYIYIYIHALASPSAQQASGSSGLRPEPSTHNVRHAFHYNR